MELAPQSDPLYRFPVVHTNDPDEMQSTLFETYGARYFDTSDSKAFLGRATYAKFESFGVGFCAYGSGTSVVDFPEGDFVRVQFALKGNSVTTIEDNVIIIDDGHACVTSPGRAARITFQPDFEQIVVRIHTPALDRALASILGVHSSNALDFSSSISLGHPLAASFRQLVLFTTQQLNECATELPQILLKQLEQSITLNLLYASHHSMSELIRRPSSKASFLHVRKAEEYIEAHWDKPIDIEELTRVSNVSARALFKSFKECRGYSPMAFAKSIRLKHAREMLSSGRPEISVTAVAFRCGFSNLGHFAHDYRELFGELPSSTIALARTLRE